MSVPVLRLNAKADWFPFKVKVDDETAAVCPITASPVKIAVPLGVVKVIFG